MRTRPYECESSGPGLQEEEIMGKIEANETFKTGALNLSYAPAGG